MLGIALRNVYKTFKTKQGRKDVLRDVSLDIPGESFVVLTGESGAGKSTLLNMIGGLELPTSGEILVSGQDVSKLSAKERTEFYRHQVGFVFQGFYLQPQLTLGENIALPGVFANMDEAACDARVHELAQMLGITDVLIRKPEAVSGGQVERACIARALFMHPKIILADEPTNNLDPVNAQNVVQLFYDVWKQTGATVIIASHDERFFRVATQILRVADAQVMDVTERYKTDGGMGAASIDRASSGISAADGTNSGDGIDTNAPTEVKTEASTSSNLNTKQDHAYENSTTTEA